MLGRCPIELLLSTYLCARQGIFLAALCIAVLSGGASQVDWHLRLSAWFCEVSTLPVHVLRPGVGVLIWLRARMSLREEVLEGQVEVGC